MIKSLLKFWTWELWSYREKLAIARMERNVFEQTLNTAKDAYEERIKQLKEDHAIKLAYIGNRLGVVESVTKVLLFRSSGRAAITNHALLHVSGKNLLIQDRPYCELVAVYLQG